jgi:hypothetical protein
LPLALGVPAELISHRVGLTASTSPWLSALRVFMGARLASAGTVPVMLSFGFEPHVAVATNLLALIFLSLGGTLPFLKGD